MGLCIYFNIIYFILLRDFGLSKPIQEDSPEDHLNRPNLDYYEDHEEVTFSYNDHNNDNDHVTFIDLDSDSEQKTITDMGELHSDNQLTSVNGVFEDDENDDEQTTSRMLDVLSRGLLNMKRQPEPVLDYEIEDRVVRYAMNNVREEILIVKLTQIIVNNLL